MAEVTRVITIEATIIGVADEKNLLYADEAAEYWKEKFALADNVSVKVQDFILEDKKND